MEPCVLFEDEHLLVANKPAGMNTHAPSPYAGEGIYEWLKHRESGRNQLAIIHRLDKETSGVIVFGKTTQANRSLTDQFSSRAVRKRYLLLSDRKPRSRELIVRSKITRAGDRYVSRADGEIAETRFKPGEFDPGVPNVFVLEAEPLTGRTHQIRVHAAENGFPILGDVLYGGSSFHRVCLHAAELCFRHPADNREMTFRAPVDFRRSNSICLREGIIDPEQTDAYRIVHGASDSEPGWYVERLGQNLLSQSATELSASRRKWLFDELNRNRAGGGSIRSVYHKILNRQVRRASVGEVSPQLVLGDPAPETFVVRENGMRYELSFKEGYSVGIFLDHRDNRRRLLTGHVASGFDLNHKPDGTGSREVLNAFAYTCAFSVCAARAGARVTSLDLSKKYLNWGRRNLALNGIDPGEHDFIYGDVFDWFRRLARKGRRFDTIILDPPTFSQSKESGVFRVEKDYGKLVSLALALLRENGVLLASTNAADWEPKSFVETVLKSIASEKRRVLQQHYVPQPPDFPVSRQEPAYLKTFWLRIA